MDNIKNKSGSNDRSNKKKLTSEKNKFYKLTPELDAEISAYEEALKFAFDDNEVKNIAITGPYGSGKTSVIETYLKEKDFVNISLNIETERNDKNNTEGQNCTHDKLMNISWLEKSIINQIRHSIDRERSILITNESILYIGVCIVSTFLFYKLNYVEYTYTVVILLQIFALLSSLLGGVLSYRELLKSKLNIALQLPFMTIENEEENCDILDRNTDYLVNVISNATEDIFVLQDIDRYKNKEVFVKLRNINSLVNKKRSLNNRAVCKFVYLVRDELFDNYERAKFFDFMIPVIPFVDSHNSGAKLNEMFADEGISKVFIKYVKFEIYDMRMLKNIKNEFLLYKVFLSDKTLAADNLLAMIMLKNYAPDEFAKLYHGKGEIYSMLNDKAKLLMSKDKDNMVIGESVNTKEYSLSQLLKKDKVIEDEYFKGCMDELPKESRRLIKTLILNGYIDCEYADYMSCFGEIEFCKTDNAFMRCVRQRKPLSYEYKLEDTHRIIREIVGDEYNESLLNYDLFTKLFSDNYRYKDNDLKLDHIVWTAINKNKIKFFVTLPTEKINDFWKLYIKFPMLVYELYYYCSNEMEKYSLSDPFFKVLIDVIYSLLCEAEYQDIIKFDNKEFSFANEVDALSKFVYQERKLVIQKNLVQNFKELSLKFNHLDKFIENNNVQDAIKIIENNIINCNFNNVKTAINIINEKNPDGSCLWEDIEESELIFQWVTKNINEFLEEYICSNNEITDPEKSFISILNNKDISDDIKIKYIDKQTNKLNKIKTLPMKLYEKLLNNNLIILSIDNIEMLYRSLENNISLEVISWINKNEYVSVKDRSIDNSADNKKGFYKKLVTSNEIEVTKYRQIFKETMHYIYIDGTDNIDSEHLEQLLEEKQCEMNVKQLKVFRTELTEHKVKFITGQVEEYITSIVNEAYDESEICEMIKSNISLEYKKRLVDAVKTAVSVKDIGDDFIMEYILDNKFDNNDIKFLCEGYSGFSSNIKMNIKEKFLDNYSEFLKFAGCFELIEIAIQLGTEPEEEKLRYILEKSQHLTKDEFIMLLRGMDLEWVRRIFSQKTAQVAADELVNKTIEKLVDYRVIRSRLVDGIHKVVKIESREKQLS